ncbi:hypothetical protein ACFWM0_07625 [Streptomyces sp. NPDC058405]|uniref:hypothetical protein n=1 Tax=unclassified Streptomyces TaxID=2593676 RepID=UPI00364B0B26
MTVKVPLKETALNAERIARIGREVQDACPGFDADGFVQSVMADLPRLELSARIARTSEGLHEYLPVTGPDALDVLLRSLPPTPEAAGVTNDFGLHIYSPHSDYVSRYLRSAEHLDQALAALARMTGYFSAELPVRHFLADFPDETMKAVDAWTHDADYRVRRLASEARSSGSASPASRAPGRSGACWRHRRTPTGACGWPPTTCWEGWCGTSAPSTW